jgi:hypothetical protein
MAGRSQQAWHEKDRGRSDDCVFSLRGWLPGFLQEEATLEGPLNVSMSKKFFDLTKALEGEGHVEKFDLLLFRLYRLRYRAGCCGEWQVHHYG